MQKFSTLKYCSLVFCILLVFAEMTSSVPFYSDDENDLAGSNREKDYQIRNRSIVPAVFYTAELLPLHYEISKTGQFREQKLAKLAHGGFCTNMNLYIRDLYELLLKKKVLDDQLSQTHQIARKSNRSPSLRLRFGKKRDPYFANPPLMGRPVHMLEDVDNF